MIDFSSFNYHHFEDGKGMHSELKQKIDFKFFSFMFWPVRVVFVDFAALSTSSDHWREPILTSEKYVGYNRRERVEASVIAKF